MRGNAEEMLQRAIVQHLQLRGHPDVLYFHPANGESRSIRTGARLKLMGVVPGAPDLCFTLPDGRAAYMEVKGPKGRLSPAQRAWSERCCRIGAPYAIVASIDEALRILGGWGVLRKQARAA